MSTLEFDPFSPETMAEPGPAFSSLRGACPFHHYSGAHYEFYVLSDYEQIKKEILADNPVWSFKFGNAAKDKQGDVGILTDPPFHMAFRAVLQPGFTPKALKDYAGGIEKIAGDLIDSLLEQGGGDFCQAFALPLPAKVMCMLLGAPAKDYRTYARWADELQYLQYHDPKPEASKALLTELFDHFGGLVRQRRDLLAAAGITDPGLEQLGTVLPNDFLSRAVLSKVEGRPLNEGELMNVCLTFLAGGQETTTNLLTNCLWRLLEEPSRWEAVKADPALIEVAIEESLRFDPPVLGHFRTSLCPVSMHGTDLRAGSKLMFSIAGANRDPDKFERPDEFRLDRPLTEARQHLSFGNGVHFCMGAPVARLEAKIALELLTRRVPNLRLTGTPERIPTWLYWGRKTFPAAWD